MEDKLQTLIHEIDLNIWSAKVYFLIIYPRGDAGGLSREYVLRVPSVS